MGRWAVRIVPTLASSVRQRRIAAADGGVQVVQPGMPNPRPARTRASGDTISAWSRVCTLGAGTTTHPPVAARTGHSPTTSKPSSVRVPVLSNAMTATRADTLTLRISFSHQDGARTRRAQACDARRIRARRRQRVSVAAVVPPSATGRAGLAASAPGRADAEDALFFEPCNRKARANGHGNGQSRRHRHGHEVEKPQYDLFPPGLSVSVSSVERASLARVSTIRRAGSGDFKWKRGIRTPRRMK